MYWSDNETSEGIYDWLESDWQSKQEQTCCERNLGSSAVKVNGSALRVRRPTRVGLDGSRHNRIWELKIEGKERQTKVAF